MLGQDRVRAIGVKSSHRAVAQMKIVNHSSHLQLEIAQHCELLRALGSAVRSRRHGL